MSDHADVSPAKAQLEALHERCNSEDLRDRVQFDAHRRLLRRAIVSTNGAPDKIAAMAETQGELVAFIVQQSIREPARLAEAFAAVHACPFRKDAAGNIVDPPWEEYVDKAVKAVIDVTPAAEESISVGLKSGQLKWNGREAIKMGATFIRDAAKYVGLIILIWVMMGRNNTSLKKELKEGRVSDIVSVLKSTGLLQSTSSCSDTTYEAGE